MHNWEIWYYAMQSPSKSYALFQHDDFEPKVCHNGSTKWMIPAIGYFNVWGSQLENPEVYIQYAGKYNYIQAY